MTPIPANAGGGVVGAVGRQLATQGRVLLLLPASVSALFCDLDAMRQVLA